MWNDIKFTQNIINDIKFNKGIKSQSGVKIVNKTNKTENWLKCNWILWLYKEIEKASLLGTWFCSKYFLSEFDRKWIIPP